MELDSVPLKYRLKEARVRTRHAAHPQEYLGLTPDQLRERFLVEDLVFRPRARRAGRAPVRPAGRDPLADRRRRTAGDQSIVVGAHRLRYRELCLCLGDGGENIADDDMDEVPVEAVT
jgi:hypothetical protein